MLLSTLHDLYAGSIPGSMAEMEALVVLSLGGNQLTGSLADYAFVSSEDRNDLNSALRFLDFSSNGLSGIAVAAPLAFSAWALSARPAGRKIEALSHTGSRPT